MFPHQYYLSLITRSSNINFRQLIIRNEVKHENSDEINTEENFSIFVNSLFSPPWLEDEGGFQEQRIYEILWTWTKRRWNKKTIFS